MTVPGHRHERIAEEILHELGAMLEGELHDPRISEMAAVTEVRVTPDLKLARIYVSIRAAEAEQAATLAALAAASGYIRGELGRRLRLRRCPELHFVLDRTQEYAERIEQLLRETKRSPDS
jgi:ribosome-binding factor A